jgi:hypothetical protein
MLRWLKLQQSLNFPYLGSQRNMISYHHLSRKERYQVSALLKEELSQFKITAKLKLSK